MSGRLAGEGGGPHPSSPTYSMPDEVVGQYLRSAARLSLDLNVDGCIIPLDPQTGEPLLLQTWWHRDPWRVCVTSLLLVATRRSQVQRMLNDFYDYWPDPETMLDASHADIAYTVIPLGLANQRAARLQDFSRDYLEGIPVRDCHGVGPYVEAAYRLVHLKDEYCVTDDKVLIIYRSWLRSLDDDPLRWAR